MLSKKIIRSSTLLPLLLSVLLTSCAAITSTKATYDLKKAQDAFNAASKAATEDGDATTPPTSLEPYRKAADIAENEVLPNESRVDLKVNALAIAAFSHWRLGNFEQAVNRSQEGLNLCQQSNLGTNRRDCGMLLITGGLVQHSKAFAQFKAAGPALMPADEAKAITDSMAEALAKIDKVNQELTKDEDLALWANEQQVQIVKNAIDVWGKVPAAEDRRVPVCTWSKRGDELVSQRFPASFPRKQNVLQLQQRIDAARSRFEPCS